MTRSTGGEDDRLAPVIPLFGAAEEPRGGTGRWHTTWTTDDGRTAATVRDGAAGSPSAAPDATADPADRAERVLVRRLRGRSLSIREARAVLAEHELDEAAADRIITAFEGNGYLDDRRLAEQLLDGALGRKAQGATVIAQTLSRRGLSREVIDEALAALPDDEAERALEFARQKARVLDGVDPQTALRRLHGQLARRGFGGGLALTAAQQAIDELRR